MTTFDINNINKLQKSTDGNGDKGQEGENNDVGMSDNPNAQDKATSQHKQQIADVVSGYE